MSNANRFIGGKKKGATPAGPVAPKPSALPPLVDTGRTRQVDLSGCARADAEAASKEEVTVEVTGRTRQVDLSGCARADAEAASEEEVTSEISGKAASPLYPAAPPKPVSPKAAPGNVVPITSAKAAPVAAVEADAGEAEAESPAPSAPAKPAAEKPSAADFLEKVKATVQATIQTTVQGMLAPIFERLDQLEEGLRGNDEMLTGVLESVEGPNPESPEAKEAAEKGMVLLGLRGQLDQLRTQLLGENPDETINNFGGGPIVPLLLEQTMDTEGNLKDLVGTDCERTPSLVRNNSNLTAKTFVLEMLKETPDEETIKQAAREGGPNTSKAILNALATDMEYAVEIVGALSLAPAESLDDPKNAEVKAGVQVDATNVTQRAAYYHDNLDWVALGREAAEMRSPAPAPEESSSAPEETGGDA
jgi:hypothetical protein